MTNIKTHTVPPQEKPIRLQEYGVGIFEEVATKSALKKVLKKQCITVNDTLASSATYIKGGEIIKLRTSAAPTSGKQLILPLVVLFEDQHLAILHKPAGILVSGNHFKTITNALQQNLAPSGLPDATLPQPVHRLDYATTGALLVGKTRSSIRALNLLFEEKEIKKVYFAVTIGKMKSSGIITHPIDGKASESHYQVDASVPSQRFGTLNLVQLLPSTGRRHQLRKHLSAIGHPILGDKEYGMEGWVLQKKGLYLHAYSLQFKHPFTEKTMLISDPLPKKFEKIFRL